MISSPRGKFTRESIPQRRVVVTGLGTVSPMGLDLKSSWDALTRGASGICRISQFNPEPFDSQIAGEVKGFDPEKYIPKKEIKKMDRFIQLSWAATEMALADSGLNLEDDFFKQNCGCIIGVGIGGLPQIEAQTRVYLDRGPKRISPFYIPSVIANMASGQMSIKYGLEGINFTVTSACASGSHSIGEAVQAIRDGRQKVMIAGGAEACVCETAIGGFAAMKALSTRNDSPEIASRPWDKDRDGFVLAEAAATLILEDYEYAEQRGAHIYAEVSGYGVSSDAYHMTSPPEDGRGAAKALHLALVDARLNPEAINYINAHGTSTPAGDLAETLAIKTIFGEHSKRVPVSSTKSMTGHTLGAAGALESVICCMALQNQVIPPTINLENASEGCDLDYVPWTARNSALNHVVNNSFGFGGTNSCLVFSKL